MKTNSSTTTGQMVTWATSKSNIMYSHCIWPPTHSTNKPLGSVFWYIMATTKIAPSANYYNIDDQQRNRSTWSYVLGNDVQTKLCHQQNLLSGHHNYAT